MDISINIQAFISQRLIPTIDGKRVAAIEILIGTPMVKELIMKGDVMALKEVMEKSEELGMQTFDSHIYKLYKAGVISLEEAMKNADSPSNLQVRINLEDNSFADMSKDDDNEGDSNSSSLFDGLALEEIEESTDDQAIVSKTKTNESGQVVLKKTPQELMEDKIANMAKA